ncbi:acid sphingomyelinase-like phosphodiesterase 3b [Ruditapes philippinarum]|uniref:acid sphingomyelinase-like phosphodiesterase 3b n=1 Tax=Ruditapes philippinarum TaxID=129788 RepID=UPI00295AADBC|nr:acid sphingomyelinase-like phosphodiesterase 3b [Ruditapes philippinarum]
MNRLVYVCFISGYIFSTSSADVGYFWHLTDFHWDFSYWTDQLSCNGMNISKPGMFGDQWCDSPWGLVEETVTGIKDLKSDVDFMLWTGDTVPHVDGSHLSTDLNKELVRNITNLMKSTFPNTLIYATFGNHDYHPKHKFPPHNNEIYNATYLIWKSWINDASQDSNFMKGGFYTTITNSGIRIVAMNSNMYYTKDTLTVDLEDPAGQFAWLDSVLTNATANNEKVILTGHVPPGYTTPRGVSWMTDAFNKKFIDIVLRHSSVIVAMHFGHEHHDSFRLFYNQAGTPAVSLFLAPSVTPWRYQLPDGEIEPPHNPGARLVKYDRQTGKQLDILQYYADLNSANANNKLTWTLGYNATSLYGIPDITPKSMGELNDKMTSASNQVFKAYMNWYNTNANTSDQFPCNDTCFKTVKCGIRFIDKASFTNCLSAVNGSNSVFTSSLYFVFSIVLCFAIFRMNF